MKILYAVQATGNGHIARAIELIPHFKNYASVDVFLSGSNSTLNFDLPVRFRSKGVSLFYASNGGLDYVKMIKNFSARRVWKEAKDLPVESYDCVIIDYESIASLSCRIKKIPCVGFGHQASFMSAKAPRPAIKNSVGEWLLKYYSPATEYIGLHFKSYDDFIFNPVIKKDFINAEVSNKGYVSVYLPQYNEAMLIKHLNQVKDVEFHLFLKNTQDVYRKENVLIKPVDNKIFNESLLHCNGVITSAGFETPAEVLHLGKKLLCIPIKAQYEQNCNAAALKEFNVTVLKDIDRNFSNLIKEWLEQPHPQSLILKYSTEEITASVMKKAALHKLQ